MRIPEAALQRMLAVDSGAARHVVGHPHHVRRSAGQVRCGQPQPGAGWCVESGTILRAHPGRLDAGGGQRPCCLQRRLGLGIFGLHGATLGQGAGGAGALLGGGQCLEIRQRAQRIAAGDGRNAECQQPEGREGIKRPRGARRIGKERNGAPLRHDCAVHRHVPRASAAQAARIPGVDQRHIGAAEEHHAMVRAAAGQRAHHAIVKDQAAADQPVAVCRARGPGPLARNHIVTTLGLRLAHRREDAAGDGQRIAENLLCMSLRQPGRAQRRGAGDHRTPGGGGIGLPQDFQRAIKARRRCLAAAELARHGHAEQSGLGQRRGKVRRQPPRGFRLHCPGSNLRRHVPRRIENGRRAHSFIRLARLLRCMSEEPPTIGMPSRSRTWRSMSNASDRP